MIRLILYHNVVNRSFARSDVSTTLLDPDCEPGDDRINAEGMVRLFEDLNVDPEDVRAITFVVT